MGDFSVRCHIVLSLDPAGNFLVAFSACSDPVSAFLLAFVPLASGRCFSVHIHSDFRAHGKCSVPVFGVLGSGGCILFAFSVRSDIVGFFSMFTFVSFSDLAGDFLFALLACLNTAGTFSIRYHTVLRLRPVLFLITFLPCSDPVDADACFHNGDTFSGKKLYTSTVGSCSTVSPNIS